MNHASVFSGIGGFDLAADWMNWNNVLQCEKDHFCRQVLKYYWPHATLYEDIKETDFTKHRGAIDILTGGFPCQPFSTAGKKQGTKDDRYLWPEMFRAIREIKPSIIVGENVPGVIINNRGMVLKQVQTDLESQGYEVWSIVSPACSVNAPHRRNRLWLVAYSNFNASRREAGENERKISKKGVQERDKTQYITESNQAFNFANTNGSGLERSEEKKRSQFATNRDYWAKFPTEYPIRSGNDGLPEKLDGITFSKWRNETIKSFGSAIVPQFAYKLFLIINESVNIQQRSEAG